MGGGGALAGCSWWVRQRSRPAPLAPCPMLPVLARRLLVCFVRARARAAHLLHTAPIFSIASLGVERRRPAATRRPHSWPPPLHLSAPLGGKHARCGLSLVSHRVDCQCFAGCGAGDRLVELPRTQNRAGRPCLCPPPPPTAQHRHLKLFPRNNTQETTINTTTNNKQTTNTRKAPNNKQHAQQTPPTTNHTPNKRTNDTQNNTKQQKTPAGLLGHFRPSHPLTRRELEARGLRNLDRLTQPYIREVRVGPVRWQ